LYKGFHCDISIRSVVFLLGNTGLDPSKEFEFPLADRGKPLKSLGKRVI
jgi:hypothetical protein